MVVATESSGSLARGWLYNRPLDLLVGCGLASMIVLAVQAAAGPQIEALVPGAVLVLVFSLPHYGATLVRVYEDAGDRRRYAFFSIYTSAALAALFVLGLRSPLAGSLILTVYLTWSPWHYTGQNYGILLMLLGRRGVPVSPLAKRLIYTSFVLCYVVTFLAIHGVERSASYAPVSYDGTVFHLMPLGIPLSIAEQGMKLAGLAYGVTLVASLVLLLRAGSAAAIGPAMVVVGTQAMWFCVPALLKAFGAGPGNVPLQSMYGAYGFLWIAAAHAAQYLWITAYYATRANTSTSAGLFLAKAAFAGFAIWTLPVWLFAPGVLGSLPHESGLALMVAAVVNLHHFVLDGAIWKLRDGRLARILMPRSETSGAAELPPELTSDRRHWLRAALLGLGALSIVYGVATLVEEHYGFERALASRDLARARASLDRLAWMGRDSPSKRAQLAMSYARIGEEQPAERELLRSIELRPSFKAWQSLGQVYEQAKRPDAAIRAYLAALELQPDDANALYRCGMLELRAGRPLRALELLERADELAPDQGSIRVGLMRARREAARASPKEANEASLH